MLKNLIQFAHEKNASDLHLCANRKAYARIRGQLIPLTKTLLSAESLNMLLLPLLDDANKEIFNRHLAIDFAYTLNFESSSLRIRAHYFQSLQGLTAVFRIIPIDTMSLKDLYAPEIIAKVLRQKNGLILVTGATGSGKSTTLSAMIHEINQQEEKHIITIEDPIERVFQSHKSLRESICLSIRTFLIIVHNNHVAYSLRVFYAFLDLYKLNNTFAVFQFDNWVLHQKKKSNRYHLLILHAF